MLLASVAAAVLKVTVAVPVVGVAAGLVYDNAKVLPLVSVLLKKRASVLEKPRAKSGMPTATGGAATANVTLKLLPGTPLLLPSSRPPRASSKPLLPSLKLR